MTELRVSELSIYPIKSCAQVSLESSRIDRFGLQNDRRWMIVDGNNVSLTQRQQPRMAKIIASIGGNDSDGSLSLTANGETCQISLFRFTSDFPTKQVTIWNETCNGLVAPDQINQQLSDFLKTSCSLVYMSDDHQRLVDPEYAQEGQTVSFADGFPVLLTTESSLWKFNQWLGESVGMNRFRSNLVISGSLPFDEDDWKTIQVGDLEFEVVKPCARCVIPSIDPESLEQNPRVLKTLAQYRKQGGGVNFGQNLIPKAYGEIRVGDVVKVLA